MLSEKEGHPFIGNQTTIGPVSSGHISGSPSLSSEECKKCGCPRLVPAGPYLMPVAPLFVMLLFYCFHISSRRAQRFPPLFRSRLKNPKIHTTGMSSRHNHGIVQIVKAHMFQVRSAYRRCPAFWCLSEGAGLGHNVRLYAKYLLLTSQRKNCKSQSRPRDVGRLVVSSLE